ncbi:uncharacterized protein Hap1MRO34_004070 [Clarias gariepinus]|uniref:mucin-15 n=1 Tax=Clarias gariepinus TaxID=13013 RepID=UPI00234D2D1B|nr:mucin-15 [Clarias gariepinus]
MQGKHTSKMSLRFAFTLLLTLQSFKLGSAQLWDEEVTPLPSEGEGIPSDWNRADSLILPKRDAPSPLTYSGDGEMQSVTAEPAKYDENVTTTSSTQTTVSITINPVENSQTQQNNMSVLITPDPSLQPSTTKDSHVNLTVTNSTTPGNSTTATITTSNTTTTTTTSTPAVNITQNSTTTVSTTFTTTTPEQSANTTEPPSNNSTNTADSTTIFLQNSTTVEVFNESSTLSTTTMNATGNPFRENVDRELASGPSSDVEQQTKSQAWGAVLGIGVGVAIVGLVVYIIVKRRNYRDFSHRKLVEDTPPEPVLRLDNSEPLDLKYGGFAYYNRGLQGDNIQMTNFPQGQPH